MEKYEIGEKLGNGEYGVTYKVACKTTGEALAMKCISRSSIIFKDIDGYVEREILNHRALKHPNVIQFKEVVLDDYKLGIVMERADGGALLDGFLFVKGFDEAKARNKFQQLIAGLSYIHFKRICHRDLKPSNILLNSKGDLKICDFGFSKNSEISRGKTKLGTEWFWAPEVASINNQSSEVQSVPSYDGKLADIWSCGVILYQMLTGNFINLENLTQCINSLRVSEDCKDLLRSIFVEDLNKRITVEQTMKHPWYLRDLPPDLTIEAQVAFRNEQDVIYPSQTEEEIKKIIDKIKKSNPF